MILSFFPSVGDYPSGYKHGDIHHGDTHDGAHVLQMSRVGCGTYQAKWVDQKVLWKISNSKAIGDHLHIFGKSYAATDVLKQPYLFLVVWMKTTVLYK